MPTETFSQTKEGSTWLTKEDEEDIKGELDGDTACNAESANGKEQGGLRIAKKDHRSYFLEMAWSSGLSKYVIRGITKFG